VQRTRDHRSNQAIAHIWTFGNPEVHHLPDHWRVQNRRSGFLSGDRKACTVIVGKALDDLPA
jgi:hypothetical protein